MVSKKICGVDLNGIQDAACRNWVLGVDGEEVFNDEPYINLGSVNSSVIEVSTPNGPEYVGGIQADLAPHGRGGGYGEVGKKELRTSVLDIIHDKNPNIFKLASALSGLSPVSSYKIVSIADSPQTSEFYQEALINALRKNKEKSFLLIWRSVLIALSEIQSLGLTANSWVGIISHSNDGIEFQKLQIKKVPFRGSDILVPERKDPGKIKAASFGYSKLLAYAKQHLQDLTQDPMLDIENSRSAASLALGNSPKPELLRKENGDWKLISPKKNIIDILEPSLEDKTGLTEYFLDCDRVIFETFAVGQLEARIRKFLIEIIDKKIDAFSGTKVAEAALYAAKRLEEDSPIYLDFLPQISTIVQKGIKAEEFHLIDQNETLRAGKVFRSKKPAQLGIQSGQSSIEVYLKKETDEQPRKSSLNLQMAPSSSTPVFLSVEQTPALGRASIQVKADKIGLNTNLDWDKAEIVESTWPELLNDLGTKSVPIPERLVKEADPERWEDFQGDGGLVQILEDQAGKLSPNWELLANKISGAISTDGLTPDYIPQDTHGHIETLNIKALDLISKIANGEERHKDNEALRFLTWQFKLCPEDIPQLLLNMFDDRFEQTGSNPFVKHSASWVLIFQGFGRAVFNPKFERLAIKKIIDFPVKDWKYREQTACMSFLLSRSKTAIDFIEPSHIKILLDRIKEEFEGELGTPPDKQSYTKFNYAPGLLAGLLRYRIKEPHFLLLGVDPMAQEIMDILEKSLEDLRYQINNNRRRRESYHSFRIRYAGYLEEIQKYMKGDQGKSTLLLDIYNQE